MSYYVPGTEEKDPAKVIMSLQQAHSNTATNTTNISTNTTSISTINTTLSGYEAAWTAWVPTVTAQTGSFTTLGTVVARYKQIGKTAFFYISIPITTNGTAAGYVQATLPFTAANTAPQSAVGRENGLTGKTLGARIVNNTTSLQFTFYDATYPGANGAIIGGSGQYETT